MSQHVWGSEETQFFYELTPQEVLDAVETTGLVCTGYCAALGSFENRVYEVELELEDEAPVKSRSDRFRVAKFYRPGRWSKDQILEEHEFLLDLIDHEIPVIAPIKFEDGLTLKKLESGIYFALFPKVGGRAPDELTDEQVGQVGRLLARIHSVGATKPASNRLELSPQNFGIENLKFLLDSGKIPSPFDQKIKHSVETICQVSEPWFKQAKNQRIHGDCHFGNLLWNDQGPFFLDFDDMYRGPCVQDLWLTVPGRDEYAKKKFDLLVESYEQMREFDRATLRLIEPLRSLRFIHFAAWMGKRWTDPAFPRAFPQYGTEKYWQDLSADLQEQVSLIVQN